MKEKHLVDYLQANWTELMGPFDLHFAFREKSWLPKWRCDITAYRRKFYKGRVSKRPVYIEVKHRRNTRDLLYEVSKAFKAIETRDPEDDATAVAVIVEYLDRHIVSELLNKGVEIYKYTLVKGLPEAIMFQGMTVKRCYGVSDFFETLTIRK